MNIEGFATDSDEFNQLYGRLINSHNRLRQLRMTHASGTAIGDENRTLESAFYALLNHEEVAPIVARIGGEAFISYLNHVAGTQLRFPTMAPATTSRAA